MCSGPAILAPTSEGTTGDGVLDAAALATSRCQGNGASEGNCGAICGGAEA